MGGHKFESIEIIVDNGQGLILECTIALRPCPALKLFRDAMYTALIETLKREMERKREDQKVEKLRVILQAKAIKALAAAPGGTSKLLRILLFSP